jgi:hypothetical protein
VTATAGVVTYVATKDKVDDEVDKKQEEAKTKLEENKNKMKQK